MMVILDTSFLSGLLLTIEIMIYKSRIVVVHRQGCVIQCREHICSDVPNVGRAFIHSMKDILYMAAVELEKTGLHHLLRHILAVDTDSGTTSFINLVKEVAYPIFLILSRRSKRTVDVAKIFFVCRKSTAI